MRHLLPAALFALLLSVPGDSRADVPPLDATNDATEADNGSPTSGGSGGCAGAQALGGLAFAATGLLTLARRRR